MGTNNSEYYDEQIEKEIEFIMVTLTDDFQEIIRKLGSVDIIVAKGIFSKLKKKYEEKNDLAVSQREFKNKYEQARSKTAQLIYELPAPNSMESQWWFSLESIVKIAMQIRRHVGEGPIICLGAPTIAYFYYHCFGEQVTLIDKDSDIVDLFIHENITTFTLDLLAESIPSSLTKKFVAVFMDPPWYEKYFEYFINNAASLLVPNGYIYASIPSILTRPDAKSTRKNCFALLQNAKMQLLSIDSNYFNYVIPAFENIVLNNANSPLNRPWRTSDLIVAQAEGEAKISRLNEYPKTEVLSFYKARQQNQFRVFLKKDSCNPSQDKLFVQITDFSKDVSTRRNSHSLVHFWTSNQIGYSIGDFNLVHEIVKLWAENTSLDELPNKLPEDAIKKYPNIKEELEEVNKNCYLWKNKEVDRQEPSQILARTHYSPYSTKTTDRRREQKNDGFRLEFQRDRDRIIWSQSFRKLANKRQVFSFEYDEISATRTRLTHSIEVMQLASTIGKSFALNADLIEAGSLCHDIGHTPFGHGGEYALDQILNKIREEWGFNHYEHGLDVLEYLENPYISISNGGFHGLNLMPQTLECVFKHTFSKDYQDGLCKNSKHNNTNTINSLYGSLESQTVRIADKISYMRYLILKTASN